jgi:ADP-ribosyl-[dinitrogen reductase] hydrolase
MNSSEKDRALGAVIGSAVGDALGAGYEFGPAPEPDTVTMLRGRLTREPAGHWTDDTAMAIAILEAAAQHGTLLSNDAVVSVGERFLEWYRSGPSDIGNQTSSVLGRCSSGGDLARVALLEQIRNPDQEGNGSLMRTGPVALPHLGNDHDLAFVARTISELTHPNPYSTDACVLWTLAIDRSIRTGELWGPRAGLDLIDPTRQDEWDRLISEAETRDPRDFEPNRYVVTALQAAWSAVHATRDRDEPMEAGLRLAVSIGDDTDTVGAITGALLGATYGVESIPRHWRDGLAGWPPEYREADLVELAIRATKLP